MKLTSRSLKIGDRIIRKSPNSRGDKSYMSTVVTVAKKSFTHTTITVPLHKDDGDPALVILHHFIWNDNEWVRYK